MISYKTTVTDKFTGEVLHVFPSRGDCARYYFPLKDRRGRFIDMAYENAERLKKALVKEVSGVLAWTTPEGLEVLLRQVRMNGQPLKYVGYNINSGEEVWYSSIVAAAAKTGVAEVAIQLALSHGQNLAIGGWQFQHLGDNRPWKSSEESTATLEWLLLHIEGGTPRRHLVELTNTLIAKRPS